MQLVMISPTNTDSRLLISNMYARRTWSTTMTSDAMIVICTIIRMVCGMWFRMMLTDRLEKAVTNVRAMHIVTAVSSFVVTASAEQMPSTCSAIGLLLNSGSSSTLRSALSSPIPIRLRSLGCGIAPGTA